MTRHDIEADVQPHLAVYQSHAPICLAFVYDRLTKHTTQCRFELHLATKLKKQVDPTYFFLIGRVTLKGS